MHIYSQLHILQTNIEMDANVTTEALRAARVEPGIIKGDSFGDSHP